MREGALKKAWLAGAATLAATLILAACTALNRAGEGGVIGVDDGGPMDIDVATPDADARDAFGEGDAAARFVDLEWAMWRLPPPSPAAGQYSVTATTVHDDITGLEWERNVALDTRTWSEAMAYCDGLELDARSDFRLPTRIELLGLVDLTLTQPGFNAYAFPDAPDGPYWTGTPDARAQGAYWTAAFGAGASATAIGSKALRVRCVRGSPLPQEHYVPAGQDAVRDARTGLVWARGVAAPAEVTWTDALLACQQLTSSGGGGFRVPNARELESLFDVRATNAPTLRTGSLGAEGPGPTWTLTDEAFASANAVVVDFSLSHATATLPKSSVAWVRCVQGP